MNFIITLLILMIILGLIIFIHELGHFIAAKKSGVYVDEFSLGMGPIILKSNPKKGKTKYSLRLFPIGGYVAMANSESDNMGVKKDEILENKSFIKRFLVLIMGIFFNFILTIVLLFLNGIIYGSPDTTAVVAKVQDDGAFFKAGIKENDVITHVNDIRTNTWDDALLELTVKENSSPEYKITINRNGEVKNFYVTPKTEKDEEGKEIRVFGLMTGVSKKYGFVEAVKYTFRETLNMSTSLVRILKNLFAGSVSVKNLSGPVGMFSVIDQVKSQGLEKIIYLIAYLSINVGIINLIPIPVFDGGRILLLIIEKIVRKKLPEKIEYYLNLAGFAIMILLMLYVTLNDIIKLF